MTEKNKNISLNSADIRHFWEERAKRYQQQELINVSNLESNAELAREKHRQEHKVLMDYMRPKPGQQILDLGAGHCAWSSVFARIVAHVDAVEYSAGMIGLARRNIEAEGLKNITLHHGAAQDFNSDRRYDIVLLSGLAIYLNNDELATLLRRIQGYLKPGGRVILRDSTGKEAPLTIRNRYSEELDANYSAHYRTSEQYIACFVEHGFVIQRHQNMFPDGSKLNKRKETILRVYEFYKPEGKI